jgi:transcriptional regulator with XRE-family HTH domain
MARPGAPLPAFLAEELNRRSWTLDELSDRSGVSRSLLTGILQPKRGELSRLDRQNIDRLAVALYPDDPSVFHSTYRRFQNDDLNGRGT